MGSSVSMLSAKLPSIISSLHFFAGQENPGIPSASLCITVDGCQDASSIDDRPPVVAGFFCVDQSSIADLLLVTAANVEAFRLSRQQRVSTFSTPVKIIAAEYAPRSSLGPVVALSSAEGRILIMNAVTFEILKSIFLRQTDLSVLNPGESLQNKAKLRATFLLIPMNNVLLAGLSNGQVSIFFLDSGVCVRQLLAPDTAALADTFNSVPTTHEIGVSCIAFDDKRQRIFVGYVGCKKLTNRTPTGQTALVNLSPAIHCLSMSDGTLLRVFDAVQATVLYICTIDSSSSGVTYLLACTQSECYVWELRKTDDASSAEIDCALGTEKKNLVFNIQFATNVAPQVGIEDMGLCSGATYDTTDHVLFLLFEPGYMAVLPFTWTTDCFLESYSIYKLFKLNADTEVEEVLNDHAQLPRRQQLFRCTYLGYNRKTQTLLIGSTRSQVHIILDVFGRYRANQLKKEIEQERSRSNHDISQKSEQSAQQTDDDHFEPTLYVAQNANSYHRRWQLSTIFPMRLWSQQL